MAAAPFGNGGGLSRFLRSRAGTDYPLPAATTFLQRELNKTERISHHRAICRAPHG
jgi:hypothetical protein